MFRNSTGQVIPSTGGNGISVSDVSASTNILCTIVTKYYTFISFLQCDDKQQYCEIDMVGNPVLKEGDSVQNPDNACQKYKCLVSIYTRNKPALIDDKLLPVVDFFPLQTGQKIQIVSTICDKIEMCEDGKPPYKLPGVCCETCEYLSQLSFGVGPEDDSRNNVTEDKRPKPNSWSDWSPWTECSRECGGGRQSRMRQCKTDGAASLDCTGNLVEIKDCNTHFCPGKSHVYCTLHACCMHS